MRLKTDSTPLFTLLLILFFGLQAVNASQIDKTLFPVPEVLKPNVEFWKKIYAFYSEKEVVIHDSKELNLVYEVINLDSLFKGVSVSTRIQWKKIDRIKKDYAAILNKLARKKNIDITKLSGKEKRVATLFANSLSASKLRTAAKQIRAQSGLRERFREGLVRSGLYQNKMQEIFQLFLLEIKLIFLIKELSLVLHFIINLLSRS